MAKTTRATADFHVGGLPAELANAPLNRLVSMKLVRPRVKKGRGPNWKKQFLAGFLRAVQYRCVPDEVIRLMWKEGKAAKSLLRDLDRDEYCSKLEEAWTNQAETRASKTRRKK